LEHLVVMVIASGPCDVVLAASATGLRSSRVAAGILLAFVLACVLSIAAVPNTARAAEPSSSDAEIERRVQALTPEIEAYIGTGMKAFDVPGLAIGIIANDGLIYSKGFGVRSKSGGEPVDARTVFQIGSTTKGFLAATMGLMVDRGKLHWDDRVVDRSRLPVQGSLGHARVPGVGSSGPTVWAPPLRERRAGVPWLR